MAVLDQQMAEISQARLGAIRLSVQPCVGIGLGRVRVVLPLLTAEIPSVVVRAPILPLKTLLARPRVDERAVDGEVLVRHQAVRALDDAGEGSDAR